MTVTSTGAVSFVRLKMGEALAPEAKVRNDAWERSYGDLQWQTLGAKTIYSPWYFLAEKDGKVQGFGVETGPGAMCCWEISAKGVTLVLDVRKVGDSHRRRSILQGVRVLCRFRPRLRGEVTEWMCHG